jgi:predicted CXXCH cytochrome family protein
MTVNGGADWSAVTSGIGTTNALYAVASANATNVVLAGAAGTVRRSKDGGLNWTTQLPGTSNDLRSLSVLAPSEQWMSGSNGTILKIADQTVPVTTLVIDPATPDGSGGAWYATTPLIAFYSTKAGTTYYSWNSAEGPYSTYSVPFFAADGDSTLYYYSADPASITEPIKNTSIKTDVTQPNASTLVTVTAVTTSTVSLEWAAASDSVSGVWGYEVYLNGSTVPAASTTATSAELTGLSPNTVCAVSVVTVDNAGNRSPNSLDAYAATDPIDTGPPTTTLTLTPSAPNGDDGWYISAPLVSLTSNEPGNSYFSLTSPTGPFTTYATPFGAVEGSQTLYFYSVDALGNEEAVQSAPIKRDTTLPSAPPTAAVGIVTTSTVAIEWSSGLDAGSGSGLSRYEVYSGGGPIATSLTTSTVLTGLAPSTFYTLSVVTVDIAGNRSADSLPVHATTHALDATPLTTVVTVDPLPKGDWYVTTPTVTLESLPTTVPGVVFYSWESSVGPFTSYAGTIAPLTNPSTLFFSAHDPSGIRAEEPTRQATFNIDAAVPSSPTVAASATSYSTIHLSWPPVVPTPSGVAGYEVYKNGSFLASVTDPFIDVVGLMQDTTYGFVVYSRSGAGALSAASEIASATTPATLLPSPPGVVFARALSGSYSFVNWSASTDASGAVSYRVWRSENGVDFSAIATMAAGMDGTTLTDATLSASKRYWYAVSTIDPRGESPLSSTTASEWASISTTATGPDRVVGLTAVEASASVALGWQASPNPATVGYRVMRAAASLTTPTVLTSVPTTGTSYFDLTVQNDEPYYYSVATVDASGVAGDPSLEILARPHGIIEDPTPHNVGSDASSCICHASHTATAPNKSDGTNKLIRFPNSTVDSMCNSCHPAAGAREQFADPLAKSRHNLETTVSVSAPFTCLTCHRTVTDEGVPAANLMRTNGAWLCVEVTNTPAGDGFCYSCHGSDSTLPRGDLTVFESSAHATVTAPATGAGIKCDACHESHSSRNESLNKYSGYMVCMQCHTSGTADPDNPDLWTRLTLNPDSNAKHAVLPQDQTDGAAMSCQNCHNTHAVTHSAQLIDPHDPSPGTWTATDKKSFCFRCHDGQALPTSAETTSWAGPVLASGAATSVTDIDLAYQRNVHGFGAENSSATTNANLRPSMGYSYDTVLECSACHDPHGSANNYALRTSVNSADGSQAIKGVVVAPVPGGGYDLRFFCNTCHLFDPTTHESLSGTSTVNFPTDCTAAGCHRHMNEAGTQGNLGL